MHYAWVFPLSPRISSLIIYVMRSLHHTKLPQYLREMKKYHLAHHYKNFELGYGVTSEATLECLLTLQILI
jgi:sterol desaturase/sphingolipid hydroxylase (fatty acid hydroxylase superfamily)